MDMGNDELNFAKSSLTSQAGYSLLEILISVAIFAIGILGIAGLQVRATNTDTHSRLLTEAYTVATDQIEEILLWNYNSTAAGKNLTGAASPGITYNLGNVGPGNRYQLSYNVINNPGPTPPNNTKTITVSITINRSTLPPVNITFLKTPVQDLES